MGRRRDVKRFEEVGEEHRQDLSDFIKHGDMGRGKDIKIPIKIIDLPEFEYDPWDEGGVGKGEGEAGDPAPQPGDPQEGESDGDGDEEGDPGEEGEEHSNYYDMDPDEFAEELDEELGLDLDPKGKQVKEEIEGDLVEMARSGTILDFDTMYKKGLRRGLAMYFDEDYLRDVLRVEGYGPKKAFDWARENRINVSLGWLDREYDRIPDSELSVYDSVEDVPGEPRRHPPRGQVDNVEFRAEDKRYKHPEITREYEKNAVVVFIRDVSGSMREQKRELVKRVFTPMDWYLTGKYEEAEFIYIAHNAKAWEVRRDEFFTLESGGGTQISSAYELTQQVFDGDYPFEEWNRYVFAAGDGENRRSDTESKVIPLMEEIDANLHGYLEATPQNRRQAKHGKMVRDHFGEDHDNVAVANVEEQGDVTEAIYEILSTEQDND